MSVYSITRSFQVQAWMNWLKEELVSGEERQWVLRSFVYQGLVPFIKSKGYVFACSNETLVATIARELFYIRGGRRLKKQWHSPAFNRYTEEDESHFHYILNEESWDEFWEGWEKLFDENSVKERNIVQNAVWTCLDLERSPQTAELYEGYDTNGQEEVTQFKPRASGYDPYLIDMAEGYQDKFY